MRTITINYKQYQYDGDSISYSDLLKLIGLNPNHIYTVTYHASKGEWKLSGILTPGKSVNIEDGMRFTAYDTSNA